MRKVSIAIIVSVGLCAGCEAPSSAGRRDAAPDRQELRRQAQAVYTTALRRSVGYEHRSGFLFERSRAQRPTGVSQEAPRSRVSITRPPWPVSQP